MAVSGGETYNLACPKGRKPNSARKWGSVAALPSILGGFGDGYATLAITQMNLSTEEASWFSAVPGFSSLAGSVLLSILVDAIGRRNAILAGIATHISGWSLLAWDCNFKIIMVGRVLTGLTLGSLFYPGQVYTVECLTVYHKRLRSSLVSLSGITHSFGVFLVILLSYFFNYQIMSALAAIFSLLLFILIIALLPESPIWLHLQGRKDDAEKSLKKLGLDQSILNGLGTEILTYPGSFQKFTMSSWISNIKKLTRKDVYKPVFLLTIAFVISTLAGAQAVQNYQVDIVGPDPSSTKTDNQQQFSFAYKSSVVSGVLILVAHVCTTLILPIIGVRKVIIPSCLCLAACSIFLGYMIEEKENPKLFVWRILAVWMITFVYNFGIQTTNLTVLGDSFPADAKGFAGIPILGLAVASSVLVKVHPFLQADLDGHVFYIYAGMSFISALYMMGFFYETVGKSLEEINERYK
ncbi:hypothetical protein V9T40_002861 [Parthenolecanium corni]|uniref:Major facilitator superfamily (MFS) profile domain-containing protein n=1 Tax=Parthenolecanium corni TaxID=536013 RepID=A0AAN9TLI6_9HEMI